MFEQTDDSRKLVTWKLEMKHSPLETLIDCNEYSSCSVLGLLSLAHFSPSTAHSGSFVHLYHDKLCKLFTD